MERLIRVILSLCLILAIVVNIVLPITALAIENDLDNDTILNTSDPIGNLDNQLRQTMIQMEGMIVEENSDVISELQNQVIYYTNMLVDNTNIDEASVMNLIDSTNDLIEKYTEYIDYVENDVNATTYTTNNYFFRNLSYEALVAITVAAFFAAGMNLSAELLTYAWFNDELDSVYYPLHSDDVMESSVFSEICSSSILESEELKFSKQETINDIDLYLAIRKFKYTKSASGRTIVIHDRYDFHELDFENLETFIDYGLYAAYLIQEANIIIPFNSVFICDLDGTLCNDSKNVTIDSYTQYYEDIATLGKGEYKDYSVTFTTSGIRAIQTFGSLDAFISIYDYNGIVLDTDDDSGYSNNAFIQYNFIEGSEYTIRVKFYDSNQSGSIKLGIMPAAEMSETETVSRYEDISAISSNDIAIIINETSNQGGMYKFIPVTMSNYVFETPYHCDSYICVIDPRQSYYLSDDDEISNSVHNIKAQVNKKLEQNIPYLIVCYVDFTAYVHEFSELICQNITETEHTYICTDCGYIYATEAHEYEYSVKDDEYHNFSCIHCGYAGERLHSYVTYNHCYEKCTGCQDVRQVLEHNYTNSYASKNNLYHYSYCACGSRKQEEHNFYETDKSKLCYDCEYNIELNHVHSYTYTPNSNGRSHTKTCRCGISTSETCRGMAYVGGDSYCMTCGQKLGIIIGPLNVDGEEEILPLIKKEDEEYYE